MPEYGIFRAAAIESNKPRWFGEITLTPVSFAFLTVVACCCAAALIVATQEKISALVRSRALIVRAQLHETKELERTDRGAPANVRFP